MVFNKLYSIAQMKRLITFTTLALLVAVTLISQSGCGTEDEITTSESNRWLELLSALPANEHTLTAAYLQDLAYFSEKISEQTAPQYNISRQHHLSGYSIRVMPGKETDEEWKQTLGFVFADVDQTIYAGADPVHCYEAVRGRFSQEDVDNAARTGPMNDILEINTYQGHEFYSWGGDFDVNLLMRSSVRPMGRGHRLALVDDFIFWVLWTEGIEEMIDSYEGNIESLADIEDYKLLAQGLEELDTVNAYFSSESHSPEYIEDLYQSLLEDPSDERQQLALEEIERETRLKPYQALATGSGYDGNGFYLAIVLLNLSEEVAQENATLLEQRINESRLTMGEHRGQQWSDVIESMEIESRGRLTLARIYGEACGMWDLFNIYEAWEPLLIHE